MRLLLGSLLFAFTVALAACGGGGGSTSLVPPHGEPTSATGNRIAHAAIRLFIPAVNAQNPASKHRLYISSSTQSFEVWAIPAQQTPSPATGQLFPVATPSPCAAASGGGLSCSLVVSAPIGSDAFYVAAYATANPSANAIPLSIYGPATVDIGASPNPAASPLSFSLDAVPASITLTVASPDPGNTPNTQVFTAGSSSFAPLGIAVTDASGNTILPDPSVAFASPITLAVTPAGAGIGLVLNSACTGASNAATRRPAGATLGAATSSVELLCAADLGNVSVAYNGSVSVDSSDTILDRATIAVTTGFVSPAPSPASIVLQSGVQATPIPLPNGFGAYSGFLTRDGSVLDYLLTDDTTTMAGTYDPVNNVASTPQTLAGVSWGNQVATATDGSFFVYDASVNKLDCWSSFASATSPSTTGPAQTISVPDPQPSDQLDVTALAADQSDHIWYIGPDTNASVPYVGYLPAGGCAQPSSAATPIPVPGEGIDFSSKAAGLIDGVAYASTFNGVYLFSASGGVTNPSPLAGAGSRSGGIASDAAGNAYVSFVGSNFSDIENATRDTTVAQLPPNAPINGATPQPDTLAAFSTSGGAADRLAYGDDEFGLIGELSGITSSTSLVLASVPFMNGSGSFMDIAYAANGVPYGLYSAGFSAEWIAAPLVTNTWNLPVTTIPALCNGQGSFATIEERGDSGPFTWSFPQGGSATVFPDNDHTFAISLPNVGTAYPVTITDRNGRSETYQLTTAFGCGV